jgi:membrane-bound serine protease (ClpP class)
MAIVVTLLILGALLLLAETLLPGGIAGSFGLLCLLAAVVTAYSEVGVDAGHLTLATVVGGIDNTRTDLLEKTGVAKTALRPSGTAVIDGERVDVVTEGNLIEPGTPVRVVAVEGLRVVVRTS